MYSDGGAMTTSGTWCQRREEIRQDRAITSCGVDISLVENFYDLLFLFPGRRVHLEISSDEELARHSSDYREVLIRWWRCGLEGDQASEMNAHDNLSKNVNHVHGTQPPSTSTRGFIDPPQYHPRKRSTHF